MYTHDSELILTLESKFQLRQKNMYVSDTQILMHGYVYTEKLVKSSLEFYENRFDSWYKYLLDGIHQFNIVKVDKHWYIKTLTGSQYGTDIVENTGKYQTKEQAQKFIDTYL